MRYWQCKERRIPLDHTYVMGIINATPDSFYVGSRCDSVEHAVNRGKAFFIAGAEILDIGGESTRPGAKDISESEEIQRVVPVIHRLHDECPNCLISIDTRHTSVAQAAVEAGADIINDVSGVDPALGMWEYVIKSGAGYVLMHARGNPRTMDTLTQYTTSVVEIVKTELKEARTTLIRQGAHPDQIIFDPGLGFAKDHAGSLSLLAATAHLATEAPILIGASRKRFLGELTHESDPDKRAAASIGAALWAASQGADVIRVHDVQETVQAWTIFQAAKQVYHV